MNQQLVSVLRAGVYIGRPCTNKNGCFETRFCLGMATLV